MAKQAAPKTSGPKRKAVPKNPRGKTVAAPVEDNFQGETLDVSDPRATTWTFFDNDACRRLVPLFNEDVIENTPGKTSPISFVTRSLFPIYKKPRSTGAHRFLYAASRACACALNTYDTSRKTIRGDGKRIFPARKRVRRKQALLLRCQASLSAIVDPPATWKRVLVGDGMTMKRRRSSSAQATSNTPRGLSRQDSADCVVFKDPSAQDGRPYVAVPSSDTSASARLRLLATVHSRSLRHLPRSYTLLLPISVQETPHTLRVDMLHEMPLCPPAPLPATQLVPTSFVQDGWFPRSTQGSVQMPSCIVLNKTCHSRGMNVPAKSATQQTQVLHRSEPRPEVLSRALLNAIEARRDCDMLYAQLVRLTHRFELSVDEVVLRFSNMDDILPEDYVRFGFENPADVDLLRTISDRVRSTRLPQPDLEMQHLENHPTTDVLARRAPGDPTTTTTIASFSSSIFAGQPPRVPASTLERPGTSYPPSAAVPAASSQQHAPPETYTVNPSSQVPSNAPPAPQNPAAAISTPAVGAGFHSLSTRPFGGPGSLLQPGAAPAPWSQPPVSPGQGAAGPSGAA
ncbi:hypothetical protein B0H13DRAFT_2349306 [Mycena leptocephala]|nr:hypothetical protein B0H13DRAFT_2349306 [Mycena leptocephala]